MGNYLDVQKEIIDSLKINTNSVSVITCGDDILAGEIICGVEITEPLTQFNKFTFKLIKK